MQTQAMAKDLMFKLRLDARDRERLEAVADHYSAPAATVVRILIKEKFDELGLALYRDLALMPAHFDVPHQAVLKLLKGPPDVGDPMVTRANLASMLKFQGFTLDREDLDAVLTDLQQAGWVEKTGEKYSRTAKARASEPSEPGHEEPKGTKKRPTKKR